jgi:hypothetical protein
MRQILSLKLPSHPLSISNLLNHRRRHEIPLLVIHPRQITHILIMKIKHQKLGKSPHRCGNNLWD